MEVIAEQAPGISDAKREALQEFNIGKVAFPWIPMV
jgi:hypothetical protein